ncbi:MAG: response regulator [Myxococcota bacterium]
MPNTLLLADDSVTIQKVVGITFANEDIELVTVDDGAEALARCREIRPSLVLADVTMPGLSGYDLCREIKQDPALNQIPVLLLAGTFETFNEELATSVGADGHVTKPFEAQVLIDRVNDLLSRTPAAPAQLPDQDDQEIEEASLQDLEEGSLQEFEEAAPSLETDEFSEAPTPFPPLEAAVAAAEEQLQKGPPGRAESAWSPESEITPQELVDPEEQVPPEKPPADPFLGETTGGHGPPPMTQPDEGKTALFKPAAVRDWPLEDQDVPGPSAAAQAEPLGSPEGEEDEDWKDALVHEASSSALPGADALFDDDALAAVPSLEPPPMIDADPMPEPSSPADPDDSSLAGKTLPPDALTLVDDPHSKRITAASQIDPEILRQSLEKVAWEAFGSLSELIVKEVVAKVEAIAWEVVPSLAERLIVEEIERLKREPPAE